MPSSSFKSSNLRKEFHLKDEYTLYTRVSLFIEMNMLPFVWEVRVRCIQFWYELSANYIARYKEGVCCKRLLCRQCSMVQVAG